MRNIWESVKQYSNIIKLFETTGWPLMVLAKRQLNVRITQANHRLSALSRDSTIPDNNFA